MLAAALGGAMGGTAGGCSSAPATTRTGFLSDYSGLVAVSETRMQYTSPALKGYTSFMVDPVQMSEDRGKLTPEERAEVARYFRESLVSELRERGYAVTEAAGAGTGRVRIALTGISDSTWWMKIHPGTSLAGAGRGGAAMEGEIIDSVTGEQLAGTVQSGVGSQFTVGNLSTVSDVENVIDQWVEDTVDRLDELRGTPG